MSVENMQLEIDALRAENRRLQASQKITILPPPPAPTEVVEVIAYLQQQMQQGSVRIAEIETHYRALLSEQRKQLAMARDEIARLKASLMIADVQRRTMREGQQEEACEHTCGICGHSFAKCTCVADGRR